MAGTRFFPHPVRPSDVWATKRTKVKHASSACPEEGTGAAHERLSKIGRAADLRKFINTSSDTIASTARQCTQVLHASSLRPEKSMAVGITTRRPYNLAQISAASPTPLLTSATKRAHLV